MVTVGVSGRDFGWRAGCRQGPLRRPLNRSRGGARHAEILGGASLWAKTVPPQMANGAGACLRVGALASQDDGQRSRSAGKGESARRRSAEGHAGGTLAPESMSPILAWEVTSICCAGGATSTFPAVNTSPFEA